MKYPEIFDTEDFEAWKLKYLRKELLSMEWDLMLREPYTDIFEVPFFTQEFCDKFIENMETFEMDEINRWGTTMMGVYLADIGFKETMQKLISEFIYSMSGHEWHTYGKKWEEMNVESMVLTMREGQDMRPRHDFVSISTYTRFDSDSTGGELLFTKKGDVINPVQGNLYMFPGQITHRYGIKRVKSGTRVFLMNYCIGE